MSTITNQVRRWRTAAGLTQSELAERVAVTRQTIGALESGAAGCSVDLALRLARVLGCKVEDLFGYEGQVTPAELADGDASAPEATRVVLGEIHGRTVARSLAGMQGRYWLTQAAHGVIRARREGAEVEVARLGAGGSGLFLAGCDPALGLLADHASRSHAGLDAYWWHAGNGRAADELAHWQVHAAAIHRAPGAQEPTFPFPVRRFRLASWEIGWVVAAGNPKGIVSAEDLARADVVVADREPGAGAHRLLRELLERAGVPEQRVRRVEQPFAGHAEVAEAVKLGVADVGIGISLAAHAAGLEFVPVDAQHCDLYLPADSLERSEVQAMLETLTSGRFRTELSAFGPYDTSETGVEVR